MQYAYFIGTLLVLLPGLVVFVKRKDLRKEMIWAGVLALPFGFSEIFFQEYWQPPSLFQLVERIGFGIESFLFVFAVGSLSAVVYEFIARKRLVRLRVKKGFHFLPYVVLIVAYLGLEFFSPLTSIYNTMGALFLAAFVVAFQRRDLIPQMVSAGFLFGTLYTLLFIGLNRIFPEYVLAVYQSEVVSLGLVFGVPIPEILFAVGAGVLWSIMYEFTLGFRTRPLPRR